MRGSVKGFLLLVGAACFGFLLGAGVLFVLIDHDVLKGDPGIPGNDGYTPVKNVDYFDGINGTDGKDGRDGVNGTNGRDGRNGHDGRDGKDGEILTIIKYCYEIRYRCCCC